VALVDDEDGQLVCQFRWFAKPQNKTFYARRVPRASEGISQSFQTMHRLLTGWSFVDHINGNGLDTRRCNLRQADHLTNAHNRRNVGGRSRFKGVSWYSRYDRWCVKIEFNRKRQHIGYFESEIDAALAYDAEARIRFGQFAALNFPRPGEQSALVG